ncbi:hypothetical protein [Pleomorphomonas sp. NRK KF1]|uniref:hypothetical protein n=1 Tax=Pleomorphomonas sp. NRK KF1 TaxID=2943000 RepID=UPI002042C723|nr:hypothetical protein [Pleomorphomonas sp. NRK KF1]MCM5554144.1 hypothetical protein [Pleomorphomonas sp. NRK KF1]
METALSLLRHRLNENEHTTLRDIVSGLPKLRRISKPMSCFLSRHQETIRVELSSASARQSLAVGMANGFLAYLLDRYQYMRPSAQDRARVLDSYRAMTDVIADATDEPEGSAGTALGAHHDRLQDITLGMLRSVGALDDVLNGAAPICRQYSPSLQCEILGLTGDDLTGPLLDIGCGEAAELVGFLRSQGYPAWGIDRLASDHGQAMPGDWFSPPTAPGGWRTIVAHLSFSLHFVHAHLHSGSEAKRYAIAYMTILDRLQPGGSFLYAPSLPFVERLLDPRRFHVVASPLHLPSGGAVSSSRVTKLVQGSGLPPEEDAG